MVGQADGGKVPVPPFSTNLEDAHRVVEHFRTKGWAFRVRSVPTEDAYQACFYKDDGRTYTFVVAPTVPEAICLAALSAVGGRNTL